MRNKFDEQLSKLHDELTNMGCLCEEAISSAIKALKNNDSSLISSTLATDEQIDRKEREIENLCMDLLLRQQPVARDLREISSALKMISDMERIGDQASDIAEIAKFILSRKNRNEDHINEMSIETIKMVTESVNSFVKKDLELARKVITDDDIVDNWFDKLKNELIKELSEDPDNGEYYIDLLMVAKYLERIADHATNIGEWVEFSITGVHRKY